MATASGTCMLSSIVSGGKDSACHLYSEHYMDQVGVMTTPEIMFNLFSSSLVLFAFYCLLQEHVISNFISCSDSQEPTLGQVVRREQEKLA